VYVREPRRIPWQTPAGLPRLEICHLRRKPSSNNYVKIVTSAMSKKTLIADIFLLCAIEHPESGIQYHSHISILELKLSFLMARNFWASL
jgi:hypothetical protein